MQGAEGSPQPVIGVERGVYACLEVENSAKPKRSEQDIARSKAMIE
jgi:hypothetical protein